MLDWIVNIVDGLGYVGIALLMLLENVFPPIPSELIMPLAGFVVTQGKLHFVSVVIAGVIGSVLGALPWYYLGKSLSLKHIKGLADRYGQWLTVSSEDIDRAKDWFERRGEIAACVSRLVPRVRTYISVPAGLSNMALLPFLFYSTLGTAIWVSLLTFAGYILGANYDRVKEFLGPFSIVVAVVIVVVSVGWVIRRKRKSSRQEAKGKRQKSIDN
ncbi:DedA family protein [Crocosphaera chwakensis]|uniref:DedA n=1 Tax=Crocosphaera chwakensis CCY0110 TaxID=391612 RepID=A3IV86_9CHRO|nr:DedA family protein [Crocosphaera chwakensis]EAZ89647.1 DedA [Crocosphaera chwakensis CCY0110]